MPYQVLARKWRPQDFSSVVGQEPIVRALRNALEEERVAQAYLFSGIRGVGKTSVARVLAKALNCEKGPGADPCNECASCVEITAGSDLDVIEVDAATYSKVEQVRELTESLKYGPARDRYKVVVIDEIHRLSRQAFDALLKIVEEPPPHLVFIFATTEIEAVPATILSRCQEFHFRRVAPAQLSKHLRNLAEAEEITASDAALRLLARAGEGSVRDAVALLDQLATYGSGTIPDDEAARILGGVDTSVHRRILGAVLDGRSDEVSAAVREIEDQGWDPRHVFAEFLGYCRDALHLALGTDASDIDLPQAEAEDLSGLAREAGYENLLRLLHQLLGSEPSVRRSEAASLALEIALLRAAELPKLTRIEEILGGGEPGKLSRPESGGSGGGSGDAPGRRARGAAEVVAPKIEKKAAPEATPPKVAPAEPPEPPVQTEPPAPVASSAPPEPIESPELPGPPEPALDLQQSRETPAHDEPAPAVPLSAEAEPGNDAYQSRDEDNAGEPSPESDALDDNDSGDNGSGRGVSGDDVPMTRFLTLVSKAKQPLAAHLSDALDLVFSGNELRILAPPEDSWLRRALSSQRNREILDRCLATAFGDDSRWRLIEADASEVRNEAAEEPEDDADPALGHPLVQAALDIFGGTASMVRESAGESDDSPGSSPPLENKK